MQLTYDQVCRALDFVAENRRLNAENVGLRMENARLAGAVESLLLAVRNAAEASAVPCQHPGHVVTADVLEGSGPWAVAHCTACGAVRVSFLGTDGKGYEQPWRRPTNRVIDTAGGTPGRASVTQPEAAANATKTEA